jgi:hypothetical protein
VGEPTVTPQELLRQAQSGDEQAIAQWLRDLQANPGVDLQVHRQQQTLYATLTAAHLDNPAVCSSMIYAAVYTLGLGNTDQLTVLVNTYDAPLAPPWRQDFSLAPLGSQPALAKGTATLPIPATTSAEPPVVPEAPAPVAKPAPVVVRRSQKPIVRKTTPAHPWKWGRWVAVVLVCGGLGAAMAQWRSGQPQTAAADAPPPQPLAGLVTPERAAALAPTELPEVPTFTLKAVGDIILGTNYQRYRKPEDWRYFFRSIQYHLEADTDLTFGNFESTFTDVPHSAKDTSRNMTFAFRSDPWYASVLDDAGFDVLNVANNHSMDFFEQGFNDTMRHIEENGMKAVGRKGQILYMEVEGRKLAFIGFSYLNAHNSIHDLDAAADLVKEANNNADIVVISVHAGKEGTDAVYTKDQEELFYSENRGNMVKFSRTVIDNGADLVLGHGPHVPRALELYNDRLIAYSLGNFLGYRTLSTQGPLGVSMILKVDMNAEGKFVGGRVIPVALDTNGVPYLDDYFQGVILVRNYTKRDFPNTPIEIDDHGYIVRK